MLKRRAERLVSVALSLVGFKLAGAISGLETDSVFPYALASLVWTFAHYPLIPAEAKLCASTVAEKVGNLLNILETAETGAVVVLGQGNFSANRCALDMLGVQGNNAVPLKEALTRCGIETETKQAGWTQARVRSAAPARLEYKGSLPYEQEIIVVGTPEGTDCILLRKQLRVAEAKHKLMHNRMLLMSLSHEFRNPVNGSIPWLIA